MTDETKPPKWLAALHKALNRRVVQGAYRYYQWNVKLPGETLTLDKFCEVLDRSSPGALLSGSLAEASLLLYLNSAYGSFALDSLSEIMMLPSNEYTRKWIKSFVTSHELLDAQEYHSENVLIIRPYDYSEDV